MQVFLVRHGQTDWNIENKAQGHYDIPLNKVGHSQAAELAKKLLQKEVVNVFSSDLLRCQQTIASYLQASKISPNYRTDLRERTFGEMEGLDYVQLHSWMRSEGTRLGIPDWEVRPPGGESMADVWKRLDTVEADLRDTTHSCVIVSHGGALAQLLTKLLHGSQQTARAFRFRNCSITTLGRRPDGSFLLEKFDEVSCEDMV